MTNNDLLRRLRYALNLDGSALAEIFSNGGHEIGPIAALKFLKKDDEQGFVVCDDALMGFFLDGLIVYKRGRQDRKPGAANPMEAPLNNNVILRKLRIALELQDEDMLRILKKAGALISKSELSAMFRTTGHRNYKECGDQFLRNFIRGLTLG